MLPRALSRGLAARTAVAAGSREQKCVAAQLQLLRCLGTSPPDSQHATRSSSSLTAEILKASDAADADEKAGKPQRRRRAGGKAAAGGRARVTSGGIRAGRAADRHEGSAASGAAAATGNNAPKLLPSKAFLMERGLPEDIAKILADVDFDYPLLIHKISAIQDAQRLAEEGKAAAEGHTKAARWGIEFEVQRLKRQDNHIDLLKDKQKQQDDHIEMLKDQLAAMEQRLKDVLTHIINRGMLDREEDRMQYGRGNEGQGRKAAQRQRTKKWARWVAANPEAAAEMAEGTGWRLQDIPREVAALYEVLRDYSSLAGGNSDSPEVDPADIQSIVDDAVDAAAPGSTAQGDGSADDRG